MADKGSYTYDYPRPMVTVDAVVFWAESLLLIERKHDPFAGAWALPGGFIEMDEPLDVAAARELQEETGLFGVALEQLHTFGDPKRDPRGRSVGVVYVGEWRSDDSPEIEAADDAAKAAWFSLEQLPPLAFDHGEIVAKAVEWRQKREDA